VINKAHVFLKKKSNGTGALNRCWRCPNSPEPNRAVRFCDRGPNSQRFPSYARGFFEIRKQVSRHQRENYRSSWSTLGPPPRRRRRQRNRRERLRSWASAGSCWNRARPWGGGNLPRSSPRPSPAHSRVCTKYSLPSVQHNRRTAGDVDSGSVGSCVQGGTWSGWARRGQGRRVPSLCRSSRRSSTIASPSSLSCFHPQGRRPSVSPFTFSSPECVCVCIVCLWCRGRRELAIQIAEQFEALGSAIGLVCAVVRP
jgi:hypothetical protein